MSKLLQKLLSLPVDGSHFFMFRSKLLPLLLLLLICVKRSGKMVICINTLTVFVCVLVYFCVRRMRFSSCTMKTRRSGATTSWTNGFSPSRSPSSSSSRLRWTVRQMLSKHKFTLTANLFWTMATKTTTSYLKIHLFRCPFHVVYLYLA